MQRFSLPPRKENKTRRHTTLTDEGGSWRATFSSVKTLRSYLANRSCVSCNGARHTHKVALGFDPLARYPFLETRVRRKKKKNNERDRAHPGFRRHLGSEIMVFFFTLTTATTTTSCRVSSRHGALKRTRRNGPANEHIRRKSDCFAARLEALRGFYLDFLYWPCYIACAEFHLRCSWPMQCRDTAGGG